MAGLKARIGAVVIPRMPVNRRTFDILRHEANAVRVRMKNACGLAHRRRIASLRAQKGLSVNVGSGGKGLPGWVNIELFPAADTTLCLDIRKGLPLADGSVRRILAEHVIEHVDFRGDVPLMFSDYFRVLEPGGVLRIIVPDAERFLKAYSSGDPNLWRALGWDLEKLPGDIYTPSM